MMRRTGWVALALAVAAVLAPVTAASAAPARSAPHCGITWGSQDKTAASAPTPPALTNIRAGRHGCYDRVVFDVRSGNVTGFQVRYVADMNWAASNEVVPLRGGAKLSILLMASDHTSYQCTNCTELVNVAGYSTFRQLSWAGSYRNATSVGLGVRARLPYRVFALPGRLVIDVAHRW